MEKDSNQESFEDGYRSRTIETQSELIDNRSRDLQTDEEYDVDELLDHYDNEFNISLHYVSMFELRIKEKNINNLIVRFIQTLSKSNREKYFDQEKMEIRGMSIAINNNYHSKETNSDSHQFQFEWDFHDRSPDSLEFEDIQYNFPVTFLNSFLCFLISNSLLDDKETNVMILCTSKPFSSFMDYTNFIISHHKIKNSLGISKDFWIKEKITQGEHHTYEIYGLTKREWNHLMELPHDEMPIGFWDNYDHLPYRYFSGELQSFDVK
ncbi:MAG: hypothetical protein HeimC2_31950 [Candidatus Heimdallarchaeota archaeon LC_2]|nr:MAG: hypothetical protein HeimC2_31950 [Candidatus Heimdallarchaeota archaeon LC_2]